jgi:signal transduction histidine kinase
MLASIRPAAGRHNRPPGYRRATEVGRGIDFGRVFNRGTAAVSSAVMRTLFAPGEDEAPPPRRTRRDWLADTAAFAFALGFGALTFNDAIDHGLGGALLVVDVVSGVALSVALWWRRRWPFGLGVAAAPILAVSSFAGPAGVVTLFTVAAYCRWQRAVAVAVLQFAMVPILRTLQPGGTVATDYIAGVLGTVAIVALGMLRRSRLQAQRERAGRKQAEEELRVEQIRHAERTRIAREMHDVLAHRISLLSMHAGALEFRPDATPEEIERAAAVIRASAHQALEDLRAMIGLLRDTSDGEAPAPPQPTLAALPALLEESRAAGMRLHADLRVADLEAVPDPTGRHALRIVQEALTNARKHAVAEPVELRIAGERGEGLTIDVSNPTPVLASGEPEIPGSGTGLVGLVERVTLSGGTLEHGRDERGVFHLRAWLPWP